MFCGKCGVQNTDDAMFCAGCGAKLNEDQPLSSDTPLVVNSGEKNRKIGMIAVCVIAVLLIGLLFILFGGRGYKTTVKKFVDAQFDADAKAIMQLIPDKMIDYVMEDEGYDEDDWDQFIEEGNESLESAMDSIDRYFGDDWKVSYEITDTEDVKGDDLADLKEDYKDIGIKVSAAKTVEVELTVKADETESSNTVDISLIKIGRSWYLDIESMGNIF